jgi:hypothetical protein
MIWQDCVDAMGSADFEQLAAERHIDSEVFPWLHLKKMIGIHQGDVAFPIADETGNVIGAHVRRRPIWIYQWFGSDEKPRKPTPFIIGNPRTAQRLMVFESQWDLLAVLAAYRVHTNAALEAGFSFVATRGAGNGSMVKGLFLPAATVYAYKQNDPPRLTGGMTPADQWSQSIARHAGCAVKSVQTPTAFKDVNDWVKAGATIAEIHLASTQALLVPPPLPKQKLDLEFTGWDDEDDTDLDLEPAKFPTEVLPTPYAEMTRETARTVGVSERLSGPIVIGGISSSIGKGLCAELIPNKTTRGNLYLIPAAISGGGKSETARRILEPIFETDKAIKEQWQSQVGPSLEARQEILTREIDAIRRQCKANSSPEERDALVAAITEKKKQLQQIADENTQPSLIVEDVTIQKLAMVMAKNGETAALISEDGADVVNNLLGRYNSLERPDDAIFVKAYSGDSVHVDRVGRPPVVLTRPCLSMVLLIQPKRLESLLSQPELTDGGFLPRCLLVREDGCPSEISPDMPPIPREILNSYNQAIRELIQTFRLSEKVQQLQVTPEARKMVVDYYNELVRERKTDVGGIESFTARYAEQACRLSINLHAAHYGARAKDYTIDVTTVSHAIVLARWFANEQMRVLENPRRIAKRALLKKIWLLALRSPSGFTVRDLQLARITSSAQHGRSLLDELVQRGHLRKELRPTKGRPGEVYQLGEHE